LFLKNMTEEIESNDKQQKEKSKNLLQNIILLTF